MSNPPSLDIFTEYLRLGARQQIFPRGRLGCGIDEGRMGCGLFKIRWADVVLSGTTTSAKSTPPVNEDTNHRGVAQKFREKLVTRCLSRLEGYLGWQRN